MKNIFTYGTLQNGEIVRALTGKSFTKVPFILRDYRVLRVKDEHFPAMIKEPGSTARGYILLNVDEVSFDVIDKWEGEKYLPIIVDSKLNGENIEAVTYIWKDKQKLEGVWSNQTYRSSHMQECINNCIPSDTPQ